MLHTKLHSIYLSPFYCACMTNYSNKAYISSPFPFSSFCTNYKIGSNSQAHTLIQLKFGTLVGCVRANSGTNFGENTT